MYYAGIFIWSLVIIGGLIYNPFYHRSIVETPASPTPTGAPTSTPIPYVYSGPNTIIILACGSLGDLSGIDCVNGELPPGYWDSVPLWPYDYWMGITGYKGIYVNFPGIENGGRESQVLTIMQIMMAHVLIDPTTEFILVGHSVGADAVFQAAEEFVGTVSRNIRCVVLLDPQLSSSTESAASLFPLFVADTSYDGVISLGAKNYDQVLIDSWGEGTNLHSELAIDQSVFIDAFRFCSPN